MEPNTFDELTKTLATATSRRQALRRMGGILGGAALAGLFPGFALASNSTCAHFCNVVFGGDTPASAQCAKDAAHGTGLCYSCGPASPGGTHPICCQENPDGTCSSYSDATCCGGNATCQNGTCVAVACTNPSSCGTENFCSGANRTCQCEVTVGGATACVHAHGCGFATACSTNADCGAGNVCITSTCCNVPVGICSPLCA